jgi:hypothetical protein
MKTSDKKNKNLVIGVFCKKNLKFNINMTITPVLYSRHLKLKAFDVVFIVYNFAIETKILASKIKILI